jgi:hypothetical protein
MTRHYCHYCKRLILSDRGYCLARHTELDRGFVDGGVGGSTSWRERKAIRAALAKWDKAQEAQ